MAVKYLRSGAAGTADGSSWTNAYLTMTLAAAGMAAGDTLYVAEDHAETQATAMVITFPGTPAAPCIVLCGNKAASPPTSSATTASVTTTGSTAITINGSVYFYGIQFTCASGGTANTIFNIAAAGSSGDKQTFESCSLFNLSTGTTSYLLTGNIAGNTMNEGIFINCQFKANAAILFFRVSGSLTVRGGSFASGGVSPASLTGPVIGGRAYNVEMQGLDLANCAAGLNIISGTVTQAGRLMVRDCKLPATWSGALSGTAITNAGFRAEMWNCAAGDVHVAFYIAEYAGTVRYDGTVVMTGGASDGVTSYSMRMEASANARFPSTVLRSPEIFVRNAALSSLTSSIETVHDGAALTNQDLWLENMYEGTNGFPIKTLIKNAAVPLAAAANQASSAQAWSTAGITTPYMHKLANTFTVAEAADIIGTVCLAKASQVIYVNPALQVA